MKTIWLINQYASTPETGIGGRHHYLASELAKRGHDVYVIAARNHHLLSEPTISAQKPKIEHIDGYKFVRVDTVDYQQAHDPKRILSWFVFSRRLAKLGRSGSLSAPDAILASSPSPFVFLGARKLARRFSCRLVFEERDFWPLTLIELGNKSAKHPLLRYMQRIEDRAYKEADAVVSNVPNAVEHMQARGMDPKKFSWVANGFSLDDIKRRQSLPKSFQEALPEGKFIVGYAGTLGLANALDTLVDAAVLLRAREDIAFVIVGEGREKSSLQQLVSKNKLNNFFFLPRVSKLQVPSVLDHFDACFIGWKKQNLYRLGIAANKIFDYMYSGKPIVHSYSGARDPIAEYKCGITVDAENPNALAQGIEALAAMPMEAQEAMGKRGREAAVAQHEYGYLAGKLDAVLFPPRAGEKIRNGL